MVRAICPLSYVSFVWLIRSAPKRGRGRHTKRRWQRYLGYWTALVLSTKATRPCSVSALDGSTDLEGCWRTSIMGLFPPSSTVRREARLFRLTHGWRALQRLSRLSSCVV